MFYVISTTRNNKENFSYWRLQMFVCDLLPLYMKCNTNIYKNSSNIRLMLKYEIGVVRQWPYRPHKITPFLWRENKMYSHIPNHTKNIWFYALKCNMIFFINIYSYIWERTDVENLYNFNIQVKSIEIAKMLFRKIKIQLHNIKKKN